MKPESRYCLLLILALTCLACADHKPAGPGGSLQPHPETDPPESKIPAPDLSFLSDTRKIIVTKAMESIGTPYHWGGHTPEPGFDCSGLVFFTHQIAGIQVPRTAASQFSQGRKILKHQLVPGDLVFFVAPDKKTSIHVGIYTGGSWFIHAPGQGRQVSGSRLSNPYFEKNFAGARSWL
ncbi:MAG: C40 family peptidase [Desulfotignum sp.]